MIAWRSLEKLKLVLNAKLKFILEVILVGKLKLLTLKQFAKYRLCCKINLAIKHYRIAFFHGSPVAVT